MALNNLTLKITYPKYGYNLPILVLMHGWDSLTVADDVLDRLCQNGFFVAALGLRGRGGADGVRDASGREIYDIYDAIQKIKADYTTRVSDKVILMGWSGGGGNALAAACKLPDTFSTIISVFGMSDYGRDATFGWYQQNSFYRTALESAIGGNPTTVPNNYYSRDATVGITNFSGGKLYLVHDVSDGTVNYNQSTRIKDSLDASLMTNYTLLSSNSADGDFRYIHTLDYNGYKQFKHEYQWVPTAKTQAAWTIPTSGTLKVMGFVVTKRFTIWLDSGVTSAATCVYDTVAGTYSITPLTTANIAVSIKQDSLTATGTATAGQTTVFAVS